MMGSHKNHGTREPPPILGYCPHPVTVYNNSNIQGYIEIDYNCKATVTPPLLPLNPKP